MARPRRLAILGGAGFIGSHLAGLLRRHGHDVRTVDISPFADCQFDLTNPASARQAVAGCDWVVHTAADFGGVGYFHSSSDWGAAQANGKMTANVLDACVAEGVERLLYTSSACGYPVGLQEEHSPCRLDEGMFGFGTPDQLYGAEKLHGARLVAGAPFDTRTAILFTVFGPGQGGVGERAKFPAAVAAKAIDSARTGAPLTLWGDGSQRRSFLYIDDACEMLATLLEADAAPRMVNVGKAGSVSCRNIAELCLDIVGIPEKLILTDPSKPTGVHTRVANLGRWTAYFGEPPNRPYRDGFTSLIDALRGARR